jgi:hypothetical protein
MQKSVGTKEEENIMETIFCQVFPEEPGQHA